MALASFAYRFLYVFKRKKELSGKKATRRVSTVKAAVRDGIDSVGEVIFVRWKLQSSEQLPVLGDSNVHILRSDI
jgi:hypothetical protein